MNDQQQELRRMFEKFYQRVYQTAFYVVKDVHLAQDVLQETFIKAFRHIERCPEGEQAGAWLATIASRTAIDFVRKQSRRPAVPLDTAIIEANAMRREVASSVERQVENAFTVEEVLRKIDTLRPKARSVAILKFLHELKDDEIAEALDLKVGTVKSRLYRVKKELRLSMQRKRMMNSASL
ncbi:RNA polymerase sigma factor [Numidum massiliense]|uniref:RNA polymerase sigma factor n=1 Tax=Numidum massiliense TaxID=1522315 RepID=UPI0006D5791A|nr:RNA polymerase sigma factor [Numidum massiliense]